MFGFFKRRKKKKKLQEKSSLIRFEASSLKSFFQSSKNSHQDKVFSELEEKLITSDVSIQTTLFLLDSLKQSLAKSDQNNSFDLFKGIVDESLLNKNLELHKDELNIILVFGVNGVGKTTSIAKMSSYFTQKDFSLVVAAADTYRAAAAEQLKHWIDSLGQQLVYHEGKSKPSAVVFDAVDSALSRQKELLIIDTAGRLHNREDLLKELHKLKTIIQQKAPKAHIKHLLVVDGTTGQNVLSQAKYFKDSVGIDGVFLTKMDSSGNGGVALSLSHELDIPVYFLGVGESISDIKAFEKKTFLEDFFF